MSQTIASDEQAGAGRANAAAAGGESWFARAYRVFAYFGLGSIFAALLQGFRFDGEAPGVNYLLDFALYAAFIAPHLVMTRSWLKQAVWGNPSGSLAERRVYITIAVVTWIAILLLQWPLPGPSFDPPRFVQLAGYVGVLWCVLLFFAGATREGLDGLVGVPGSTARYSHGPETMLFTEGPYEQVRHPMYRAAIFAGLSTLLIHPHAAQLFWCAIIGATFILFIPIEEAQMLAARGDDYRRYCEQTPWRLFRGVW